MKKIVFILIAVLTLNAYASIPQARFKKESGTDATYEFLMNKELIEAGKRNAFTHCYPISRRDLIKQERLAPDRRIYGGVVCNDREQPIIVLM